MRITGLFLDTGPPQAIMHLVTVSLTVSVLAWVERINVRAKCLSQRQNADSGHNSNPDLSISNPAM